MATDFLFSLEDRPGTGARILTTLGQAGVNVIGLSATSGGQIAHVAVEDVDAAGARSALQGAGVSIREEREVVVAPVEDRPGAGGALLQRLADADINIEFLYLATGPRILIGVENPARARQALSL